MKTGFRFFSLCLVILIYLPTCIYAQDAVTESSTPESIPVQASLSKAQMDSLVADSKRKSRFQWSINPRILINFSEIRLANRPSRFIPTLNVLFGIKNKNYMLGIGPEFKYQSFDGDWSNNFYKISADLLISNRFFVNLNEATALEFFLNTGFPIFGIRYIDFPFVDQKLTWTLSALLMEGHVSIPFTTGIGLSFGSEKDIQFELGYSTKFIPGSIFYSGPMGYLSFGVNVSF